MVENSAKRELISQLVGWILFIICGVLFMVPAVKHRDVWTLGGCICFLGGCVFFIIPLIKAIINTPSHQ